MIKPKSILSAQLKKKLQLISKKLYLMTIQFLYIILLKQISTTLPSFNFSLTPTIFAFLYKANSLNLLFSYGNKHLIKLLYKFWIYEFCVYSAYETFPSSLVSYNRNTLNNSYLFIKSELSYKN